MCVIVISGLARYGHYRQSARHNPISGIPIVDSKEYVDDAVYYLDENAFGGEGAYFHPPLYSYFIALVFFLFGRSVDAVIVVQILLDMVSMALMFFLGRKAFGAGTAIIGVALYGLYATMIQFSVEVLPPALIIVLMLSSVAALGAWCEARNARQRSLLLTIGGSLFGALVVTLSNFLVCIPAIVAWIWIVARSPSPQAESGMRPLYEAKGGISTVLFFLIPCMIPVVAVMLRNYYLSGEIVLLSSNAGIQLYLGNNPDLGQAIAARPGMEWEKILMYPYEQEAIRDYGEQSLFWVVKVLRFVLEQPMMWLGLMLQKAILFFTAHEFPRNFSVSFFRDYTFLSRLPFVALWAIMPLALVGLATAPFERGRIRHRPLFYLTIIISGLYIGTIIVTFVTGRYRLPVMPFFALYAAWCLSAVYAAFRKRRMRRFGAYCLAIGVLAIGVRQKPFLGNYPYDVNRAHTYALIGNTLLNQGRYEDARRYLMEGLEGEGDGSTYELYHYLAHYYAKMNDRVNAIRYFKKSVELNPENYRALNSLGFHYKMIGEFGRAREYLEMAKGIAPCYPEIYLNLADCSLAKKDWKGAVKVLENYYKACPSPHPMVAKTIALLYMDYAEDWGRAALFLEQAVAYPQGIAVSAETYNRLGVCYYYLDDHRKAGEVWRLGLVLYPDNADMKTNMHRLHTGHGEEF